MITEWSDLRRGIINGKIYEQRFVRWWLWSPDGCDAGSVDGWSFYTRWNRYEPSETTPWRYRTRAYGGKIHSWPPGGLQRRRCLRKIIIVIIIIIFLLLLLLYDGKRAVVLIICIALYFTTFHTKAARRRPWPPLWARYTAYRRYIIFCSIIYSRPRALIPQVGFLSFYRLSCRIVVDGFFRRAPSRIIIILYYYLHCIAV